MRPQRTVSKLTVIALVASIPLAGCQHVEKVVGGATGALLCNEFYKGKNKTMVTALCAAGGAFIAAKIKEHLKKPEDRAKLEESTYTTLDTGKKQTFKTEDGTTVTTELVKQQPQKSASAPTPAVKKETKTAQAPAQPPVSQVAAASECGTVKQTIVTKDNQRIEENVSACMKDGVWVVA